MTPWEIKGREFGNCNCAYGCPCQFNALPTHGHCRGLAVYDIEEASTARRGSMDCAPPGFSAGPVPFMKAKARACTSSISAPRRRSARRCCASSGARTPSRSPPCSASSPRPATGCTSRSSPISSSSSTSTAAGARQHRGRRRDARRADPQSDHRGGAPRAHRATERLRIRSGRDRARLVEDGGPVAYELYDSYGQFARIHLCQSGMVR